ncbi:hypothetical protein BM221_005455 [Beauveria bassiana]|uniref:Uncharacterized protein n=1 Tax=Beauveria bassiana TaxID=176275 RepID=A0A2N6NNM0_BEABA|nr:hypothetical protein BM221_005455 [Beauveria bassiana]
MSCESDEAVKAAKLDESGPRRATILSQHPTNFHPDVANFVFTDTQQCANAESVANAVQLYAVTHPITSFLDALR